VDAPDGADGANNGEKPSTVWKFIGFIGYFTNL